MSPVASLELDLELVSSAFFDLLLLRGLLLLSDDFGLFDLDFTLVFSSFLEGKGRGNRVARFRPLFWRVHV